ncbi:nucleolar complex protein 3 homolog [Malaya genurostris]|uniref:nucleolar complex protein 3 homolog n=1 Tax=Malaya genurostris TaxID=325434 RepID=UPI0026F3C385|nr:nucleolar complex protein 3 homolog [Malaya genurostris]XP_058462360.1 nucleolar complex protein 3 homolog [Malaya genurostris]
MPIRKKIKISSAKRGHHEKHKKNFGNFKGSIQKATQNKGDKVNIFRKKCKATRQVAKKSNDCKGIPLRLPDVNVDDIGDMIDDFAGTMSSDNSIDSVVIPSNISTERADVKKSAEQIEDEYRIQAQNQLNYVGKTKPLLPIKTKKGGIINRNAEIILKKPTEIEERESMEAMETNNDESDIIPVEKIKVSTTDLLMERFEDIEKQKYMIGITCASIVENPELKVTSLQLLLDLITETNLDAKVNMFVIRKLALISLVEVFKDIVPEYRLGIVDANSQKLKKSTLLRVNYEKELLLQYKKFLVLCEEFTQILHRGRVKQNQSLGEKVQIAEIAVQCICDLLIAHPYFNYSLNKAQMLVTLLNNDREDIRKRIYACFVAIFKVDNRFDISIHIVRHINQLVKKKQHAVHSEMIGCLKYLPIKDINVDAEKEHEMKLKKLEAKKSRVINLSKQERKRKKKLKELEKELFETKAEENSQVKLKKSTDLSKLVFMIFFRILKTAPKSKLLSVTLEGLAKFAHTINIDFFSDLIDVLDNLLIHGDLGYREQLHCIKTVFTILKGQGEILNIDPARFYTHLYKNLLSVHAGKTHDDLEPILMTLDNVLLKRRNNITYHRYLAFVKRLSTMTLQLLHFGTLGCLGVIKMGFVLNSSLDVLLDTECVVGSGKYDPNVEDPEFSNASSTNLYELSALHRHYHTHVRRLACNIANNVPSSGPGMLPPALAKLTPLDLFIRHDSTKMAFVPVIPAPKENKQLTSRVHRFNDPELEMICSRVQRAPCNGTEFFFFEKSCKINK